MNSDELKKLLFRYGHDKGKTDLVLLLWPLVEALEVIGASRTLDGDDTASAKYARQILKDLKEKLKGRRDEI